MVKNKTDFSPLGTKVYFRVNSLRKKLYCNTLVNTFLIYSVLSGRKNLPFFVMRAVCLVSGQEIINYSYFPFSIGRLKKSDKLQLIFKNFA